MNEPRYRVTVYHDPFTDNPNDYSAFRVVSFNNRHVDSQHPDTIDRNRIVGALSYYEHGLCRWMLGASTVPDPGGFDTVDTAGVIVYDGTQHEWLEIPADDRRATLEEVAATYTAWCNGETYGYTVEAVDTCDHCGQETPELVESVGGFIGVDWLKESVRETLGELNVEVEDCEVREDCYSGLDFT